MHIAKSLTLTLAVAFAATLSAQTKPNFSGNWTVESSTPSGVGTVSRSQLVKHDAATLSVGHAERGHHSSTYLLDGKAHETMIGPVKSVSKAEWDGDKLILDRTDTFPTGVSRTMKQVWSLDSAGKLTIVLTDKSDVKEAVTLTTVYVKS